MKLYLYNTVNKNIYETNDLVILNNQMMDSIYDAYKEDLDNEFGEITINSKTLSAEYSPYTTYVKIDANDDFKEIPSSVDVYKLKEKETIINVTLKDLAAYNKWQLGDNNIVKYYNGKFNLLTLKDTESYNPATHAVEIDINKLRAKVKDIILHCENDVRYRGFKYTYWDDGSVYYQPFRVVGDNDLQVVQSLKNLDYGLRGYKLFTADTLGHRITAVGSYKWLKGTQVTDMFLDLQIKLIIAYSGYIKDAIYTLSKQIDKIADIGTLYRIRDNYVDILIDNMAKLIVKTPVFEPASLAIRTDFKEKGIVPLNDLLL